MSHLLNVHGVRDVSWQTEKHTSELSVSEIHMATTRLKRHKSPHTNQITREVIQEEGRTQHSEMPKFLNSTSNK